jgi:hypothetical protein
MSEQDDGPRLFGLDGARDPALSEGVAAAYG